MTNIISAVATELLALESLQRTRTLDEKEQERWEELAVQIFSEFSQGVPSRKSFRLKCKAKCTFNVDKSTQTGELLELSLRGFSLKTIETPITLELSSRDFSFNLQTIEVQDQHSNQTAAQIIQLNLKCETINFKNSKKGEAFGSVISQGNDAESLQTYVDKVYYPFYIKFLENLVRGS